MLPCYWPAKVHRFDRAGIRVEPAQKPDCAYVASNLETAIAGARTLLTESLRLSHREPLEIALRAATQIAPEDLVSGRMIRLEVDLD